MISISYLRTQRLAVQCQELSLGDAITICKMDGERHESVTTSVLRAIVRQADMPRPGFVTDPLLWTVSERMRVITHYLCSVAEDGPDFALGELHFSDYVDLGIESQQLEVQAKVGAQAFTIRPLLGIHAELLERSCSSRGEWIIGAMACQMSPAGEAPADLLGMTEVDRLQWIADKLQQAREVPESVFEQRMGAFFAAQESLKQWFNLNFDKDGLVAYPTKREAGPQPARFQPLSLISAATRTLFEGPDQ
jgi:hypothetical protein